MLPATIEAYERPTSIAEALTVLSGYEDGEAMFLAGGQSAMQAIKSRMLRPQCVVDLQDVAELKGINDQAGLVIGAMVRYKEIARAKHPSMLTQFAALRDAANHIGDRQVRNRGTIGGSLCWNYVASCMPSVVLGLGGELTLQAAEGGSRSISADDFFIGPLETARADNEILVSVSWPSIMPRAGSAYAKWGLVTDALPVIGVCVAIQLDTNDVCANVRVSIAGLANGAQRSQVAESHLIGSAGDEASVMAAFSAAAESIETHDDQNASADYRQYLIRKIGRDVALRAFSRARQAV